MINPKQLPPDQPSLDNSLSTSSHKSEDLTTQVHRTRLKDYLNRLRVGQKICLGYGLALGIAVVGTTTGIIIGDYYQEKAWHTEDHIQREKSLLYSLQTNVLQIRTHQQQLIPLSETPPIFAEEYSHILNHSQQLKQTWSEIEKFIEQSQQSHELHNQMLPEFMETYQAVPDNYLRQLARLVETIDIENLNSQAELQTAQRSLLAFTNSELALRFDGISDDLKGLVALSEQEDQQAATALKAADKLRLNIIIVSMLVSIAIAIVLAIYTSRAIARPIQSVTNIAQRATEDSNFHLQAPVTTQDEIGTLAVSLNQLMQRVEQLLKEQKIATEKQLIQSEKMSSLGRMLAGVAHEINNPVNFIYGNIDHAKDYIDDLFELIHTYEEEIPNLPPAVEDKAQEIDREFLEEDLPKLIQSMKIGAERARQIVLSLRNFSRLEEENTHPVDLHECIDSTLLILHNRIKKDIEVVYHYGAIPQIEGYMGSLYQVFMNLLSNAVDALSEKTEGKKTITITTQRLDDDQVSIRIADNALGISPENQAKIFDTFFTTKPAGVGTGLGLSISHNIIVEKHHGQLLCSSEVGKGTEFEIILPIKYQTTVTTPTTLAMAS